MDFYPLEFIQICKYAKDSIFMDSYAENIRFCSLQAIISNLLVEDTSKHIKPTDFMPEEYLAEHRRICGVQDVIENVDYDAERQELIEGGV